MATLTQNTDAFLRQHGFAIASRPKDGSPMWKCQSTHQVMSERVAYSLALERKSKKPAEAPEDQVVVRSSEPSRAGGHRRNG